MKPNSVPIEDLRANPWNTNIVSPENEAKLDEALKRFGFFKPIVVREIVEDLGEGKCRKVYQILGGEHRWESSKRLGYTEVPIFSVGEVDDVKAKEISLADNARYGADDTVSLAALMEEIGTKDEIHNYLPYTETDIASIFASHDIALDELELDDKFEAHDEKPEKSDPKAPKTHTIMRFKVQLGDAERITESIARTQKNHGYTSGDELTNAGDALVHLLFETEEA